MNIIRLYDEDGNHKLSIIPCSDGFYDLATPDGKCLYCGIDTGLFESFGSHLKVERVDS